jgi:hypothetical protein
VLGVDAAATGSTVVSTSNFTNDLQGAADCDGLITFGPPVATPGWKLETTTYALDVPSPNPFRERVTIRYRVPEGLIRSVDVRMYNVRGELVRTLAKAPRPSGWHEVEWNGDDASNRRVASGAYFAVMRAGAFQETRKVVLNR